MELNPHQKIAALIESSMDSKKKIFAAEK